MTTRMIEHVMVRITYLLPPNQKTIATEIDAGRAPLNIKFGGGSLLLKGAGINMLLTGVKSYLMQSVEVVEHEN